jgi:hypothetical protein
MSLRMSDLGMDRGEKKPTGVGSLPDRCGLCAAEIQPGVPDRAWEFMKSPEGVLAASNFCRSGKCEPYAQRESAAVVSYQRIRLRNPDDRLES